MQIANHLREFRSSIFIGLIILFSFGVSLAQTYPAKNTHEWDKIMFSDVKEITTVDGDKLILIRSVDDWKKFLNNVIP